MTPRTLASPFAATAAGETSRPAAVSVSARARTLGIACGASGALGVAVAGLTLAWSPSVGHRVWSYPFSFRVGVAVGISLTVIHLMTLCGYVALRSLARSRMARAAAYAAIAGCALLAVSEAAGGAIGRAHTDSTAAGIVSTMFGLASLLLVAGSISTGAAFMRRQHAGIGVLLLASGGTLLVLVTPANISGDLTLRMASLMVWSASYVGIGGLIWRTDGA
jgi:hypothetical protein